MIRVLRLVGHLADNRVAQPGGNVHDLFSRLQLTPGQPQPFTVEELVDLPRHRALWNEVATLADTGAARKRPDGEKEKLRRFFFDFQTLDPPPHLDGSVVPRRLRGL